MWCFVKRPTHLNNLFFLVKPGSKRQNISCAEPNYGIRHMKSSKYESVKFDRFVFGTTRRSTRLRQSNKTVNVLHQLNLPDWPTKSPVNLNQHA